MPDRVPAEDETRGETVQIADKVFVVTGGGNGIGREVVITLVRRGARVAAVDLSAEGLAETQRLAAAPEGRLSTHTMSVADRAAVEALPDQVIAAHGQVDGILNIAGIIQRFVHVEDLSIEEIERIMAVNFWGTLYMDKTFLPLLKARPQAALLNVSSMGGLVPVPGQGAYGASKGAVKLLTETLFAELRGTHVAVTVVFPGGVGTNITGNSGVEVPNLDKVMASGKTPKTTAPVDAARLIVDAVAEGRFRLLIGGDARMLDRLSRVAPTRAITTVADQMKKMLGI
jgi:NAD(P)-dependent dehydrogenase (short-subunit alcohol dehydrogenase family)